jgi:hypothetical protein
MKNYKIQICILVAIISQEKVQLIFFTFHFSFILEVILR